MAHVNTWEPGGVYKRFTGFLTGDELVASAVEVAADPRFDDLRHIINDFSDVPGHSVDTTAIDRIALVRFGAMQTNPNVRVVIVASEPSLTALATLASRGPLVGSQETVAFGTLEEARRWLAVQPALVLPRRRSF